jgi:SAM-dependent methyltransferase
MKRDTTDRIRYVMDELMPPAFRDSRIFYHMVRYASSLIWGAATADDRIDFRLRAATLTPEEYSQRYRGIPRIHDETDNSAGVVRRIIRDVIGPEICDVGCGTGFLLRQIARDASDPIKKLVGVDVAEREGFRPEDFEFVQAPVEQLPFEDHSFDTVMCTHVIEHILDYRKAISELRRITRRRLIIVVPREREALYAFNLHVNFYPYRHSFLRAMIPLPRTYSCEDVSREIYYTETRDTLEACGTGRIESQA